MYFGSEAGYKCELMGAIRVYWSVHEVRVSPEPSFWKVSLAYQLHYQDYS